MTAWNGFGSIENGRTLAEMSTTAMMRAAAVREAVLRPQNGPDTRPNGFGPPIGLLGSSINEEISQGDVSIEQ